MITIYLVRHGENIANITKEFSCRKVDYSLTEKGILQSRQTAQFFKDKNINYIYTSPLKRAYETACIINKELEVPCKIIEEFRELNVGDLEDSPGNDKDWDLFMSIINDWENSKHSVCFPGGENFFELVKRMRKGLSKAINGIENINIVIVAHGGIFSCTIQKICTNMKKQNITSLLQSNNCSITKMQYENNCFKLLDWADSTHMYGEAAKQVAALPEN